MIPSTPELCDSLEAVTVTEIDDESAVREDGLVSRGIARSLPEGSKMRPEKAIVLVQSPGTSISISSLASRIAGELHGAGHIHCAPKSIYQLRLARKVLAVARVLSRYIGSHVDAVNSLINVISETRISQWAVMQNSAAGNGRCLFGDFVYETFDVEGMLRRCERAGSQLLQDDVDPLRGKLAILRVSECVKTVNFNDILPPRSVNIHDGRLVQRIVDAYFRDLVLAERERFLDDLDREQAVYGAIGLSTLSSELLRKAESLTQWITIFDRKERKRGWVLMLSPSFDFEIPEPARLSDGHRDVIHALKLGDWGQKSLDPSIQQFCHFLSVSQFHENRGNVEESLLYIVFALDLLLGAEPGKALTSALADRVAMLTHTALNRTQLDISNLVRKCYETRSKYVHRGERNKVDVLSDLKQQLTPVARAVLGAACYARSQPWARVDQARQCWHGRIDVVLAKQKAKMDLDENDVHALGIKQIHVNPDQEIGVRVDSGDAVALTRTSD